MRDDEQICTPQNSLARNYNAAISDNELSNIANQPIYKTMIDVCNRNIINEDTELNRILIEAWNTIKLYYDLYI